jgi:hypothetical protein
MTESQEDDTESGDIVKEIDLEADDEQQKLF